MDFLKKYFLNILENHYVDFNGRTDRKTFWIFNLLVTLLFFAFAIISVIYGELFGIDESTLDNFIDITSTILSIALTPPSFGIAARRLHDIGKSAFWLLMLIIPIVGIIWLIYLFCKPSQEGPNKYGEQPFN